MRRTLPAFGRSCTMCSHLTWASLLFFQTCNPLSALLKKFMIDSGRRIFNKQWFPDYELCTAMRFKKESLCYRIEFSFIVYSTMQRYFSNYITVHKWKRSHLACNCVERILSTIYRRQFIIWLDEQFVHCQEDQAPSYHSC